MLNKYLFKEVMSEESVEWLYSWCVKRLNITEKAEHGIVESPIFAFERELNEQIEFLYIEYWELKTQEVEETGSTLKS